MRPLQAVRSLFGRRYDRSKVSENTQRMAEASAVLNEMRGERISAQPPENGPSATDNIAEAIKDYGGGLPGGRTGALKDVAKSYRATKKRRSGE